MFVNSEYVVLIGRHRILGWNFPKLHPRKSIPMIPVEEIPPAFSIPLADVIRLSGVAESLIDSSIHMCERIPDWYNQSHPLTALDILHPGPKESDLTYTSLNLALPQPPFKGRLDYVSSTLLPDTFDMRSINLESRICNDWVIQGSVEDNFYRLTLMPKATETAKEMEPLWLQISPSAIDVGSRTRRGEHSFDPISGRLCVMIAENEGACSILVFDLLQ